MREWLRMYGISLTFLGVYTVMDLRRRKVWWPLAVVVGGIGCVIHVQQWQENWQGMAVAAVPGLIFLICAALPRHLVGTGDGIALVTCGLLLELSGVLELLMLALLFCACWSLGLLLVRRAKGTESIPFMPFLLAAQICLCIWR